MYLLICLLCYFSGEWVICKLHKHMFSCLLSLEIIILFLFSKFVHNLLNYDNEMYFSMIFLSFSVCEGALSLFILVFTVRSHSNDYLSSFKLLFC